MVYSTIVIFDFSRPDFIYKAVDFLIKEASGTDSEIILLKSYVNPYIEKFLDDNNIKYIDLMNQNKQSDYIKAACKFASGEVLIFMDDDDIFYPTKIQYISGLFKSNPNLGYYHNNFDTVDEFESITVNRNYKTPEFEALYIANNNKPEFFKKAKNLALMLKIRPDFNSSSIAIRRKLLSEYHDNYDFNVRPDSFIFVLALISPLDIMLDNKVLTHYRIHSSNISTAYNTDVEQLRKTFTDAFSTGITMFNWIEKITNSTPYEKYIKLRIINLKLAYNFWSLTTNQKIKFSSIIMAIKIDFIHELEYFILSIMPRSIKLETMKIFYHAKK